ncbi:MAG: thiamine phosphate synthase [Lachnospira sp.]
MNTIQNCKEFCEKYRGKIFAVTNRSLVSEGGFYEQIEKIGQTKPGSLILREKDMSLSEYILLAEKILEIADRNSIRCILHNFPDAAIQLNCRNIHMPLGELKALADNDYKTPLGNSFLEHFDVIGTSIHSTDELHLAEELKATYVTAGHIYETDCKKGLKPRGLDFLRNICRETSLPVYAIGGIKFDCRQIDEILDCGASGACIMSGFMKI